MIPEISSTSVLLPLALREGFDLLLKLPAETKDQAMERAVEVCLFTLYLIVQIAISEACGPGFAETVLDLWLQFPHLL